MHLLVMILMAALIAHDGVIPARPPTPPEGWMLLVGLHGYAVLLIALFLARQKTLAHLRAGSPHADEKLRQYRRMADTCRWLTLPIFLVDLYGLGGLLWLREKIGDWVLLDELLLLAPAMGVLIAEGYFYYPIDRALRGESQDSPQTRGRYVLYQVRHQVLLVFAPMAALLAWGESLSRAASRFPLIAHYEGFFHLGGTLLIFALTPWMIRLLWDTAPLPRSTLREKLTRMCDLHRVRVAELLLWRTYGGMVNGAVMGFVAPLRFILLTDGLIQRMSESQIEAVMAHELGHIRRRHMPWMAVCAVTIVYALETAARAAVDFFDRWAGGVLPSEKSPWAVGVEAALLGVVAGGWVWIFGFISRRFERQADTFAVQHLSREYPDSPESAGFIGGVAVQIHCDALERVAAINHLPPGRKSWRHGSIQWRCDYLRNLVGTPLDRCPIDRTVRRICGACFVTLLAVLLYDNAPELRRVLRGILGN